MHTTDLPSGAWANHVSALVSAAMAVWMAVYCLRLAGNVWSAALGAAVLAAHLANIGRYVTGLIRDLEQERDSYGQHRQAAAHHPDPGTGAGTGPSARHTLAPGISVAVDPRAHASSRSSLADQPEELLPLMQREEPIKAWRAAYLVHAAGWMLMSLNGQRALRVDDTAHCVAFHGLQVGGAYTIATINQVDARGHAAPDPSCTCGFYAFAERRDVIDTYLDDTKVLLEVELFGTVIEHERGYRAGRQRVLSVYLPGRCSYCGQAIDDVVLDPDAIGVTRYAQPVCRDHAPGGALRVSHRSLEAILGVPVRTQTSSTRESTL